MPRFDDLQRRVEVLRKLGNWSVLINFVGKNSPVTVAMCGLSTDYHSGTKNCISHCSRVKQATRLFWLPEEVGEM